jgi:hypothetical protein
MPPITKAVHPATVPALDQNRTPKPVTRSTAAFSSPDNSSQMT